MIDDQAGHTRTLLPNGKVLIAGGLATIFGRDPGDIRLGSTATRLRRRSSHIAKGE
jgi:hypothetical protein